MLFRSVIGKHRDASYKIPTTTLPKDLAKAATDAWDRALELGTAHGYRNAQVSVLAPTGTIAFMMDCDTTGIEPDFALVKFKKLAGGGYFKIVNASVPPALEKLGYTPEQVDDIVRYCVGTGALAGVLAIAVHSIGFTGKFLSEAIEEAKPGPVEALVATGASPLAILLKGIWPQVKPAFLSLAVFRWDINVRESAVLGLVGGGGLGKIGRAHV